MTNGFDKLLRESLDAGAAAGSGECLDAAMLAAWFDGTLSRPEHAAVEAHAASCSRCQAMIAALVRTDRPAPGASWHRPAMRWLVPLAVAASLILLINVLRPGRRAQAPAGTVAARLDQGAPAAAAPAPAQRPTGGEALWAQARPEAAKRATAKRPAAPPERREKPLASDAAPETSAAADARSPSAATAPVVAPEAPPAKEEIRTAQATNPRPAAVASGDVAANRFARTVAESVAGKAVSAGRRDTVIFSTDRSVQWRIAGTGQVERSLDGLTWQTQAMGIDAALAAGSAPSAAVCWMVGAKGVVLRTTDSGQTWTRVAFPEEVDLVTVVAVDDKVATVTALGGQQFHTTDGQTWK
jgi:hypothetical protein